MLTRHRHGGQMAGMSEGEKKASGDVVRRAELGSHARQTLKPAVGYHAEGQSTVFNGQIVAGCKTVPHITSPGDVVAPLERRGGVAAASVHLQEEVQDPVFSAGVKFGLLAEGAVVD